MFKCTNVTASTTTKSSKSVESHKRKHKCKSRNPKVIRDEIPVASKYYTFRGTAFLRKYEKTFYKVLSDNLTQRGFTYSTEHVNYDVRDFYTHRDHKSGLHFCDKRRILQCLKYGSRIFIVKPTADAYVCINLNDGYRATGLILCREVRLEDILSPLEINRALIVKPLILKFVEQTDSLCDVALAANPRAIEYVDNPTPDMINTVLSERGKYLKYIKNPTFENCCTAAKNSTKSLKYVPDSLLRPSLWKYTLKKKPASIKYIKTPTIEMYRYLITLNAENIRYIKKPPRSICRMALEHEKLLVKYVPYKIDDLGKSDSSFSENSDMPNILESTMRTQSASDNSCSKLSNTESTSGNTCE